MSFTELPSFYAARSRNLTQISQENVKPHIASLSHSDRLSTFNCSFDDASDWDYPRDSVTKKRRHAVYMHRPPVWCSEPTPFPRKPLLPAAGKYKLSDVADEDNQCDHHGHSRSNSHYEQRLYDACPSGLEPNFSQTLIGQISGKQTKFEHQLLSDITAAMADADAAEADASESEPETPLLNSFSQRTNRRCDWSSAETNNHPDSLCSSEDALSNPDLQSPFRQTKAGLCTRLQSYKDIRLEAGGKWAVQEGSLVACIDPMYTHFESQKEHLPDEFELVTGDLYVVCRLYADLWALCIKISFDSLPEDDIEGSSTECSTHIGFLPLCAVTLAANFSLFIQRCLKTTDDLWTYPGTGLPVTPPERSHSLNASKQIGHRLYVGLSAVVYDTWNALSMKNIDMEFIPLDSTLQPLFSDLGGRQDRVHRLGKHMSLRNLFQGTRSSDRMSEDVMFFTPDRAGRPVSFQDGNSDSQSSQAGGQRQVRRGRWASFSSVPSQGRKWFSGMSPRGIWDLMLTGSDRPRGHSRGNSTASDPVRSYRY